MGILSGHFNLKESFPFYGAYHNEGRNKLIHLCFVPVIFTTSLHLLSYVNLGRTGVTAADVVAVFYAASFLKMEPVAGLMYAPVIGLMHHVGTTVMQRPEHTALAVGLHVTGWVMQFIGHGFFERRKPAVFDNLLLSLHSAVFFVWLELLFALGYRPALRKELQLIIDERIAAFDK